MKIPSSERRFLFNAFAQSVAGFLRRPETAILNDEASQFLPEDGGRQNRSSKGYRGASGVVQFDSADTDLEGQRLHDGWYETKVTATVEGINVLDIFTVEKARASMITRASEDGDETEVRLGECFIKGLKIKGCECNVQTDTDLFNEVPTLRALEQRFESDATFRQTARQRFLWHKLDDGAPEYVRKSFAWAGEQLERENRLPKLQGTAPCTIVKKLECDCPDVTVHGHTLRIPNFGRVFFGVLLASRGTRRLNMLQFDLGSPAEGQLSMDAVMGNGSFFP